jgi:hypothetical protein
MNFVDPRTYDQYEMWKNLGKSYKRIFNAQLKEKRT